MTAKTTKSMIRYEINDKYYWLETISLAFSIMPIFLLAEVIQTTNKELVINMTVNCLTMFGTFLFVLSLYYRKDNKIQELLENGAIPESKYLR